VMNLKKLPTLLAEIFIFWAWSGRKTTLIRADLHSESTRFVLHDDDISNIKSLENNRLEINLTEECLKRLKLQIHAFKDATFFLVYIPPKQKEILISKTANYKEILYDNKLLITAKNSRDFERKKQHLSKFIQD